MPGVIVTSLVFLLISTISIYAFWQSVAVDLVRERLVNSQDRPVLPEHIFDVWFLSAGTGLLAGRILYMISSWESYASRPWGLVPYQRIGTAIKWFERFPWTYIDFSDGVLFSGLIVGFLASLFLILILRGISPRHFLRSIKYSTLILVLLISASSIFIPQGVLSLASAILPLSLPLVGKVTNGMYIGIGGLIYSLVDGFFISRDFRSPNNRAKNDMSRQSFLIFSVFLSGVLLYIFAVGQVPEYRYIPIVILLLGLTVFLFSRDMVSIGSSTTKESGDIPNRAKVRFNSKIGKGAKSRTK